MYRGYFYMGCYGASSPKRHVIWSNDYDFVERIISAGGYLSATQRAQMASHALANHTVDPVTGKKRFTGVKKKLKDSQTLTCKQNVQCTSLTCTSRLRQCSKYAGSHTANLGYLNLKQEPIPANIA